MVLDTGNTLEPVILTVPPLVLIGCCAIIRWLKLYGTAVAPGILSAPSGPGTYAGKMWRLLGSGVWPKDEAGAPKFLPSTRLERA
jgi:hypothetical protein